MIRPHANNKQNNRAAPRTIKQRFFSFSGRVSRAGFWRDMLLLIACHILLGVIALLLVAHDYNIVSVILYVILSLVPHWNAHAVMAKRYHDLGRTGWWACSYWVALLLAGIISHLGVDNRIATLLWIIVLIKQFIELGFLKGTAGSNRFGEDTLKPVGHRETNHESSESE